MNFPASYEEILKRIDTVDPLAYAKTRNYLDGAVTKLSPYISRGVISTKQVLEAIQAKGYQQEEAKKLIQELAWREYYQRVWQHLGDDMFDDIWKRYIGIQNNKIPDAIVNARTGIQSIDNAIHELYATGYMHNHLRMYIASIICNIGKSNWQLPAQWMYYHLLDGDLASNSCSWQWVTGHFSSCQYFCNQENINKFTGSQQQNTFLEKSYDELPGLKIPGVLTSLSSLSLQTILPEKKEPVFDTSLPLVIYTSYNLDPLWKQEIKANRILLLEPSHFKQFPVSKKVIDFILSLSKNIKGLQVFCGELYQLQELQAFPEIYSKEHPLTVHYPGLKEDRDWLFPATKGLFPSFFKFWNQCKKNKEPLADKNHLQAVA